MGSSVGAVCDRPSYLGLIDLAFRRLFRFTGSQALFLPVAQTAKLNGLEAGFQKRLRSARRAPTSPSVEDQVGILREVAHAFLELCHWNVKLVGNCATLCKLLRLTDVNNQQLAGAFHLLLQVRNC